VAQVDPVFIALADPTRRQIVEMLSGGEGLSVNEIADHFEMSRQAVAKHLNVLRRAEVISGEQRGRKHIHTLVPGRLNSLAEWVEHYSRFWDEKLSTLKSLVEKEQHNERD